MKCGDKHLLLLNFIYCLFYQLVTEAQADILAFQEVRFDFSKLTQNGPSQIDHLRKYLPQYQVRISDWL